MAPKIPDRRPGGELYGRDSVPGPDGSQYDKFGKKVVVAPTLDDEPENKDIEYARRYWEKHTAKGQREAMVEILEIAAREESFSYFVSPDGIKETDKERLSAFRLLAGELGYEMGEFVFNNRAYNATASITKSTNTPRK